MRTIIDKLIKRYILAFSLLMLPALLLTACRDDPPPPMVTIGVVNLAPPLDTVFDGFKEGMITYGHVEGETITYIYEGPAGSIEALELAVQRLVNNNEVDLILSLSTPATQVVKQIDSSIPTIFVLTNPVEAGVVDSMIAPGGTLTGVTFGASEGQRLEWLLRIAPHVERIFIPYNPEDGSPVGALNMVEATARELGIELVTLETRTPEEIIEAARNIPEDIDAVFLLPDSLVTAQIIDFVQITRERGLPLSVPSETQVEDGALMAFGSNLTEIGKQAARLADQVLQGADPANTPVEYSEFFLTINLKTADIIGLSFSNELLRQANTIIR